MHSEDDKTMAGLRALVIGGTGGIGFAVAQAMAADGARLVLHGHSLERLEAQASALRSLGASVTTVCADLSTGDPSAALLEEARAADLLVMAYGPFVNKSLADTTLEDWRLIAMGGLALPGIMATAAATGMAARGFGRILLFGGTRTDAIRGFKANAAYAAAKTGLGVLAKSIAVEFGGSGVSCAVICPGFVDTEYLDDPMRQRLTLASPRGGLIPVAEIAELALSLLAGQMDLANGSILVADRGLYAL
ncbi:MAG TPA: SDR family oxidoreductase [bacterium]|nr:SDR family oxidoreductase [bacterium]